MSVPVAKVHTSAQIFSPYSGLPADGENGPNQDDPTLLFVYYGNAGDYAYVSNAFKKLINRNIDEINIESLHSLLTVAGGLILEVDTDWNGLNFYGFAPTSS